MAEKPLYYTVKTSFVGPNFEYRLGEVVDANDPIAKKYPEHFGPLVVRSYGKAVEQATASPGEKRSLPEPEPPPPPEPGPEPPQGKAMTLAGMKGKG